jgi:hypothetical protein
MQIKKRLITALILALAGTMLWANLSWAQGRGGGRGAGCPWNQTNQNTWQGRGQGNANCLNYPGFRGGRGQGQGPNAQGFQGQRGPQGSGQNPQVNNPNVTQ